MTRLRAAFAIWVVLCSGGAMAQQQGQRQQTTPPPMTEAPPVDAEVEKFKRIFDLQATEDQERKFRGMLASTELAQRHARDLLQQLASSSDTIQLMHRATTLEDDIDQALTDYRIFRRSLADQQEFELKKQMKKLITSVHAISKNSDTLSQELNRIPVNSEKLRPLGERLEKELGLLHSAQVTLGKEMSIQVE